MYVLVALVIVSDLNGLFKGGYREAGQDSDLDSEQDGKDRQEPSQDRQWC